MSHFCLKGDGDTAVTAVSVSGSTQAIAYVWGGASSDAFGKAVDLWSQADEVRITANESYPPAPPGYVFSYSIPSRYVGLTFIGVKPGTKIRETQNQIRVCFDSPGAAKTRADRYLGITISPSTAGRPTAISTDLWVRLLTFTRRHEGGTDFMYNDKGKPQLVTCGVGKMFPSAVEAIKHKRYFVGTDGGEPTAEEMTADFEAAHELKRTEKNLWDFATVTLLRMPWEKVTDLLGTFMGEKVSAMLGMHDFVKFATFPQDAQLACASIAYGGWGYGCFAPLRAAISAQDWTKAAEVYKSPGWDPNKNAAHIALFRSAGGDR
jgi:hypothetical protein